MDLSKLDKSEQIAARVYIRNRRKAWDCFFELQDLKNKDYITDKNGEVLKVLTIEENYEARPYDIAVTAQNIKTECIYKYVLCIRAVESGLMGFMIECDTDINVRSAIKYKVKKSKAASTLYGKK